MSLQVADVPCPYCGSTRRRPWAEENGYQAVRCQDCAFVYVSPRVPTEAVSEAAQTGLHETPDGRMSVVGRFRRHRVRVYRQRLRTAFPDELLRRPDLAWLDVGAGFGELLLALRELTAGDAHLEGVEPCLPKLAKARSKGLSVSSRSLRELDRRYDVVSLVNVFSHLPDPRAFLRDARRLLKPGGELFVVTGNGADVEADDYPKPLYLPDHLVFAGEEHVRSLLIDAGFEIVRLDRYREFLPEGRLARLAGNAARMALGRPFTPWWQILQPRETPFRSLFVRAVQRD